MPPNEDCYVCNIFLDENDFFSGSKAIIKAQEISDVFHKKMYTKHTIRPTTISHSDFNRFRSLCLNCDETSDAIFDLAPVYRLLSAQTDAKSVAYALIRWYTALLNTSGGLIVFKHVYPRHMDEAARSKYRDRISSTANSSMNLALAPFYPDIVSELRCIRGESEGGLVADLFLWPVEFHRSTPVLFTANIAKSGNNAYVIELDEEGQRVLRVDECPVPLHDGPAAPPTIAQDRAAARELATRYREFIPSIVNEAMMPRELPIEAMGGAIVEAIQNRRVTLITGPPGCGKTSFVVKAMIDRVTIEGGRSTCLLTAPTRDSAMATSACLRRVVTGTLHRTAGVVGHLVRDSDTTGPETMVTVSTVRRAVHAMAGERHGHPSHGTFVIDELQTLRSDVSIAISQARLMLRQFAHTRVVLLATTPALPHDSDHAMRTILDYFDEFNPSWVDVYDARNMSSAMRVQTLWDNPAAARAARIRPGSTLPLPGVQVDPLIRAKFIQLVTDAVVKIVVRTDFEKVKDAKVVAAFIPGSAMVRTVAGDVVRRAAQMMPIAVSTVTVGGQQEFYTPEPVRGRPTPPVIRIYVGTPAMEVSGLRADIIVDSCLEYHTVTDTANTQLKTLLASQTTLLQRASLGDMYGSAGCTVIRVVPQFMWATLPPFREPGILTDDLDRVILDALKGSDAVDLQVLLDIPFVPGQNRIRHSISWLAQRNLLECTTSGTLRATDMSRMIVSIPLPPTAALSLWLGTRMAMTDDAIVVAVAATRAGAFSLFQHRNSAAAFSSALGLSEGVRSDPLLVANTYLWWKRTRPVIIHSALDETTWVRDHYLSIGELQTMDDTIAMVRRSLARAGLCTAPDSDVPMPRSLYADVEHPMASGVSFQQYIFPSFSSRDPTRVSLALLMLSFGHPERLFTATRVSTEGTIAKLDPPLDPHRAVEFPPPDYKQSAEAVVEIERQARLHDLKILTVADNEGHKRRVIHRAPTQRVDQSPHPSFAEFDVMLARKPKQVSVADLDGGVMFDPPMGMHSSLASFYKLKLTTDRKFMSGLLNPLDGTAVVERIIPADQETKIAIAQSSLLCPLLIPRAVDTPTLVGLTLSPLLMPGTTPKDDPREIFFNNSLFPTTAMYAVETTLCLAAGMSRLGGVRWETDKGVLGDGERVVLSVLKASGRPEALWARTFDVSASFRARMRWVLDHVLEPSQETAEMTREMLSRIMATHNVAEHGWKDLIKPPPLAPREIDLAGRSDLHWPSRNVEPRERRRARHLKRRAVPAVNPEIALKRAHTEASTPTSEGGATLSQLFSDGQDMAAIRLMGITTESADTSMHVSVPGSAESNWDQWGLGVESDDDFAEYETTEHDLAAGVDMLTVAAGPKPCPVSVRTPARRTAADSLLNESHWDMGEGDDDINGSQWSRPNETVCMNDDCLGECEAPGILGDEAYDDYVL
ncbi:hypothetical protein J8273_3880 [Carpediemonas membranifera]|uniref:Helicase ATP-binding domain-containing protein n=1 Tax=Carpediemonas membranifera TaxID=201153 RepID=A0A8J6BYL4_9EUKA|nr:hypothetical protein J8273_3880 [Carpediemonas membranifera]|eukprot:KAG9394626.1 hypothetical protein J8273_3880 [Carpediemonas membranifera]